MAQPAKVMAIKPDDFSPSLDAHMLEKENQRPQVLALTPTGMLWHTYHGSYAPNKEMFKMCSAIDLFLKKNIYLFNVYE